MDLEKIKKIVNSDSPDTVKQNQIITVLANDENSIGLVMMVLAQERSRKKELISDMNLELSRAHIFIDGLEPHMKTGKHINETNLGGNVTKSWILDNIAAFYIKYKGMIGHCFNRFN